MRIIVIYGPTNSGKTSSLNIFYNLLLNRGGISTGRTQVGADPHDFEDIILLNNKRIGIFTVGDLGKQLVQAIHRYNSLNCDEFICACNNKFVIARRVINTFTNVYVNKIKDSNPNLFQGANSACAAQINSLV